MGSAAYPFSDADTQLSTAHQLGTVLAVYRLKPVYLRLFRGSILLLRIVGGAGLITLVDLGMQQWQQVQTGHALEFLLVTGTPLVCSVAALFGGVLARHELQRRVIVCEGGLLQVRRLLRRQRVEVMRWQEIVEVRRAVIGEPFAYALVSRANELTLSSDYQQLDELVTLITQHCGGGPVE